MALTYECSLTCVEESFRLPDDSISAALGVDYVSFSCDEDPEDGDGCEMLLGILVDAMPPFDGSTFPPTNVPLKLACVDLLLPSDAECDECFPVEFEDGIDGSGSVPLKNLISAADQAFAVGTADCEVCVINSPVFRRGDCNLDETINVSDPSALVTALFLETSWKPDLICADGCDINDDGRLDLSDILTLLFYVFNVREITVPQPGPFELGRDPTEDKLGCEVLPCPDNA